MANEIWTRYSRFAEYAVRRTMELPFAIGGAVDMVFQWGIGLGMVVGLILWLEPEPRFDLPELDRVIAGLQLDPPPKLGVFTRPLQLVACEALLATLRGAWKQFCSLLDGRESTDAP